MAKSAARKQEQRVEEINSMGVDDKKERITKLLEQTPSKIKLKTPAALGRNNKKDWDDSISYGIPEEGQETRGGRNAKGKAGSVRNDAQDRSNMRAKEQPSRGDSPTGAYNNKNSNKLTAYTQKNKYL